MRSSLRLTRGAADSSLIANAWRAAAYCYNLGGILDSAVLYSQKLLSYGQRNHDLKLTKNALNSLAALSNNNDRPEIALSYFKEVYEINQKIGDTADMGGICSTLALPTEIWKSTTAASITWSNPSNNPKSITIRIYLS